MVICALQFSPGIILYKFQHDLKENRSLTRVLSTCANQQFFLVVIEGDMMVDESFINNTSKIRKRGAILRRFKSHSLYWPGANSDHRRIVRVPYTLDTGFFSSFFGKRKRIIQNMIYITPSSVLQP